MILVVPVVSGTYIPITPRPELQCSKCRTFVHDMPVDSSFLVFHALPDEPVICEFCLASALGLPAFAEAESD